MLCCGGEQPEERFRCRSGGNGGRELRVLGEGEKVKVKCGVIVAVLGVNDGVERQEGEGG